MVLMMMFGGHGTKTMGLSLLIICHKLHRHFTGCSRNMLIDWVLTTIIFYQYGKEIPRPVAPTTWHNK